MSQPNWLNETFFQKILSKSYKNTSILVQDVRVEPCGAANVGFLSTSLRVYVNYIFDAKVKRESFVLKLSPSQEIAIEKVGKNGYDVHNKEMWFFEVITPQIVKILRNINENGILLPKTIAIDRDLEVIVFEDLKTENFVMVDRMIGMDDVQIKMALTKLAKFQAASLVLFQKRPTVFRSFDAGKFSRNIDVFNFAFNSIFELVGDEVLTWQGFESYGEKLQKLRVNFIELATRCFDVKPGDFCVLNHGDLWTNNLMFRFDENGGTKDVILIDFQFCHWGSPALDLMHFLYTSLQENLYDQQHIEAYVQFFYYELKKMLQKLNYDLRSFPTLHEFQVEFDSKMFYGLVYTLTIYPIMISDDAGNDFTAHHSSDERSTNFKKRMLKASKYERIVKKMLPAFDQKGILEKHL